MTEILLVRHGETHWNLERRIQGQRNSELSPAGLAQAQALARRLGDEEVDLLVSSDLGRTLRTAEPLAHRTGRAVEPMPGLRERAFGIFEGLTLEEIAARHPEEHERWRSRDPDYAVPGGESLAMLRQRVAGALDSILARGVRRVIAITHGGVLDAAYRVVCGVPDQAARRWELRNASINTVRWHDGAWRIVAWGDIGHLEAAEDDTD